MDLQRNMSNILNAAKTLRNQSLTEFSDELEVSRSHLNMLIKGRGNPRISTIEHIAAKLGISPDALIAVPLDSAQLQVIELILQNVMLVSTLSPETRNELANHFVKILNLLEKEK